MISVVAVVKAPLLGGKKKKEKLLSFLKNGYKNNKKESEIAL